MPWCTRSIIDWSNTLTRPTTDGTFSENNSCQVQGSC